jgi:hypothetical protein
MKGKRTCAGRHSSPADILNNNNSPCTQRGKKKVVS